MQRNIKLFLKYGTILACVLFALLALYIGILMQTKGEARITNDQGKLNISSNWRTNSISRIRIWEQGSDRYKVFTTRGGGKNFILDLHNIPKNFRNLAESPATYKEGNHYYIALDIQYDIPIAASMRTQYFDFIFSETTEAIPEIKISHDEQPEWIKQ